MKTTIAFFLLLGLLGWGCDTTTPEDPYELTGRVMLEHQDEHSGIAFAEIPIRILEAFRGVTTNLIRIITPRTVVAKAVQA